MDLTFSDARQWIEKSWYGLLVAYLITLIVTYGSIWFYIEPMDIQGNERLSVLTNLLSNRWGNHILLCLIIAPHLTLLLVILSKFKSLFNNKKEDNITEMSKLTGCLLEYYEVILEINIDGSYSWKSNFKLKAIGTKLLSHKNFYNLSGDSTFENTTFNISTNSTKHRIEVEKTANSKQYIDITAKFSPAIKDNETIDYSVNYKSDKGLLMTFEEVAEQLLKKQWAFSEPYEFSSVGIRYPTEFMKFSVIFPIGYNIYGDEFFEITSTQQATRLQKEWQQVSHNNWFKRYQNSEGKMVLELNISKPIFGIRYYLKWKPPTKTEYEQVLRTYYGINP